MRKPGPLVAVLLAFLCALGTSARAQSYESLEGSWWFSLGGKDAGALLIELNETSAFVFEVDDSARTGNPSFGFSRALGGFFEIASGQELRLDSRGNVVGELVLTEPGFGDPIGTIEFLRGRPSELRTRLKSNGTIAGDSVGPLRVKLDGRRAPANFDVLTGRGTGARIGGPGVSSRSYELEVLTHSSLGLPAYRFAGAGPARVDRVEDENVTLDGQLMLAPNQRVYGLLDDSSHFGTGAASGRLRVPSEDAPPKLDLTIDADRRVRGEGFLTEPVEPVLSVDPLGHDFGAVALIDSRTQVFLVENVGVGLLTGEASFASGSDGDFAFEADASYSDLAPGDPPVAITVVFAPTEIGARSAQIVFGTSGGAGARIVDLVGVGGAPLLGVDPLAGEFGDVEVGSAPEIEFTITNDGDETLSGTASLLNATDYTLLPSDSETAVDSIDYEIEPGADLVVRVRFAPTDEVPRIGTLVLTGDGGASVELTGTGITPP